MSPTSRVFANRYELGDEIGHGGMADVYLAHDRLLDRRVAVKVLLPHFASDPTNIERFRREAQAAAGLNHPHIVAVYDWGEEDDTSFIVMEYVAGQTLRDILQSYGPLEPMDAARIAAEIADALSFAHTHGVVHRDVKPGNVLVTPQGQVKVTDFGIARADTSEPLTKTGSVLGTATYFSPEQAQGLPLDGRSDVYALGVVLYEMLTGVAPFTASSPVSVAYKHVREAPAPPSSLVAELPGAMDRIVLTAMAKDVDERYASAQDMRADLLRFERGRPLVSAATTAPPAPTSVRVAAPIVAVPAAAAAALPEPEPRGRGSRWGPAVAIGIALTLLVALIVFLIAASDFGDEGSSTPTFDVPNVVGQNYTQAAGTLTTAGFVPERVDVDEPEQAPDLVVGQNPEEGRKVAKGGKITLKVSSATITMPNIVGQNRTQAAQTLAASNLVGNFVDQDSDQPVGTVLGTDPGAGGLVNKLPQGGRPTVTVTVAREPAVPVPDVTRQDPAAATALLGGAGFQVTTVPTPSDTVPAGQVIGTDPATGTPLQKGAAVNLLVSSGPSTVAMPSVVNLPRADAEQLLNVTLGLGVQVNLVNGGPTKKGVVITQNPPAGTPVQMGATVQIFVGA